MKLFKLTRNNKNEKAGIVKEKLLQDLQQAAAALPNIVLKDMILSCKEKEKQLNNILKYFRE